MQDDEYLVLFYDKSDEKQSEIYDQLYNDYTKLCCKDTKIIDMFRFGRFLFRFCLQRF